MDQRIIDFQQSLEKLTQSYKQLLIDKQSLTRLLEVESAKNKEMEQQINSLKEQYTALQQASALKSMATGERSDAELRTLINDMLREIQRARDIIASI